MKKMNQRTAALAAAGVVSLSPFAQAQEAVAGAPVATASGTLTGYVSTSYTMVKDGIAPAGYWNAGADTDRYALDVVDLKWFSPQGAGEGEVGYTFEIWAGPSASKIGSGGGTYGVWNDLDGDGNIDDGEVTAGGSTVEIMEANMDLRVNVENGLDFKVGYFKTVVGAETHSYGSHVGEDGQMTPDNMFHSRSFGFQLEPTHHTGILASYNFENVKVRLGVANDSSTAVINSKSSSSTLFLGSLEYKLPYTLGPLSGATLKYAVVSGMGANSNDVDNHYLELKFDKLGIDKLSYKLAWDWVDKDVGADDNVLGHYLSYAINDKVTLNARIEMGNVNQGGADAFGANQNLDGLESYTLGLDYQLWQNVTSRIEWRVDDADNVATDQETLGINIIYSF